MTIRKQENATEVKTLNTGCGQYAAAVTAQAEINQHLYHELAQCSTAIPSELMQRVQVQLDALHAASGELRNALQATNALEDELRARLLDGRKSVERKWYKPNPPANASIDLKEQEKNHFARGMNLYKVLLILFIGSFAGVVIELLWCFIRHGYFESRSGLVWGPFNLLYGAGAAALSMLLYRYRNRGKWLSFAGGMIIGSVLEYACSWWMEAAFGVRSWDYSQLPFNLNGRICLLYSVFWGFLGVVWIKDIYPRIAKWILKIPDSAGKFLTWAVTLFLMINCVVSCAAVSRWAERKAGVPADTQYRQIMDARFPDERMESVYANMVFD